MKAALRTTSLCTISLALTLLLISGNAQQCLRRFTSVGADCGTLTDTCTLNDVTGTSFSNVPFPSDNHYNCYRTCYMNGENGDCIATANFGSGERPINVYATDPNYVAMKFSSPHYRQNSNNLGNYRKSNICRYHVKCSGNKRLYYAITGQSMQDTATCSNMAGVCVDRIRLIFPNVGECERCSSMSSITNANCVDRSGLGDELMVEFTANREQDFPGFEILANCVEPGFDQNSIPPPDNLLKRQVEECISPVGMGARTLPQLPSPAERIQRVLDRDPNAAYIVLEETEDAVSYIDGLLTVGIGRDGLRFFPDIVSLEVESPLGIRRYFRIAPGAFNGFAQLAVSEGNAFLVQFGVNPNLLPTDEESTLASILDDAIAEAVGDLEQFDVLDELDLLEQAEEFNIATNSSQASNPDSRRKKRGIEPGFIEALSMEYGNACNGVLRTSACIYQQIVMGRNCTDE